MASSTGTYKGSGGSAAPVAKQATLYDPSGKGKPVVVDVGSGKASELQKQGWTLTDKNAKPVAKLPVASGAPSAVKGGVNTLPGYDVNNNGAPVFVEPGKYYQGISATPVDSISKANDLINERQQADYDEKAAVDEPQVRGSVVDQTKELVDGLGDIITGGKEKPTAPKMEDTYNTLRDTYKITDLETQLADANKEEAELRAADKARREAEANKGVDLNVIEGRRNEITKQTNEALDRIMRNKQYLSDQLNSKYSMVQTMMNLKQTDYQNAVTDYDKNFNQNLQMINFVRGVQKDQITEQDKKRDDARANFTVMANAITTGGMDYNDLPADQKLLANKLELQSGFPIGFLASLKSKNPKSDIITTTTRTEANGNKYADIIMRDTKTGKVWTEHQLLGKEKVSGSGGGVDSATKERKQEVAGFKKDAADWIEKLDQKDEFGNLKYDWGSAYDSMKVKYPQFEDLIDESLGGGFDKSKNAYYGRADRPTNKQ